jgi:hypothetical protein
MPWRFMKALEKALELSSCAAACVGPNTRSPWAAEIVDHARRQRRFGADHRQHDLFFQRPLPQQRYVGDVDVFQPAIERRAAIARGDVDGLQPGRLRELPGQRVFPATAADNEYFHALPWLSCRA